VTRAEKTEEYCNALNRFLPEGTAEYVSELILSYEAHFRITKKRKTKLGDYRSPRSGKGHHISVNGDLNKYAFLITTIHEFAHLTTYNKFKHNALPHGLEWKSEFKELFDPIFNLTELPEDINISITNYLKNAKASSCSDDKLSRVLKRYDKNSNVILVEHLNIGDQFKLKGKIFVKGKKLRKYYLCQDINSRREYRVLGLAQIETIE
tara:strand:- start:830 stop:1453 length:624 start_codon:yes stop_codon:yes gene_type:complete